MSAPRGLRIATLPGVYRPRIDSALLVQALAAQPRAAGERALELCTGSGVVGLSLARRGHRVVAVDVSRRAALSARLNAAINRVRLDVRHGDLFGAVRGERFDVIVANPPYLPSASASPPKGATRAWDAGADGRAVIDRIIDEAPHHLTDGGVLYLMQSSLADTDRTLDRLASVGFAAPTVVASHRGPLGPIAAARVDYLVARGHARDHEEELVVIHAPLGTPARSQADPAARAAAPGDPAAGVSGPRVGWHART